MTTKIKALQNRKERTCIGPEALLSAAWAAFQYYYYFSRQYGNPHPEADLIYTAIYDRIKSSPFPYDEFNSICCRFLEMELNRATERPDNLLKLFEEWEAGNNEHGFYATGTFEQRIKRDRKESPFLLRQLELMPWIFLHMEESGTDGNVIWWSTWALSRNLTHLSCAIVMTYHWKMSGVFEFSFVEDEEA